MKRFYYIANIRLPTERAHGIQIMEMCKAFADLGHEVELLVTKRKTPITDDPFTFYDLPAVFKIKKLWCLDTVRFGWFGFWLESLTFTLAVLWRVMFTQGIFYTRDESLAVFLRLIGKTVAWEAHMGQKNLFVKGIVRLKLPIIVITESLKELYRTMGVAEERLLVAPDGADIDRFDLNLAPKDAREELDLPLNKKIVLYKGSLAAWKGAGTLAEAASLTNTPDLIFVFIGGSAEDVAAFKKEFAASQNLMILGNRPRKETPIYQKAADVLVIPNSAKEDISKLYTSPMKLFGYMAGGVPIVASDLPSLKEILNDSRAYFFKPDDPTSLAHTIDQVFSHYPQAQEKASRALTEVRQYSWKRRAAAIINFVK